MGVDDVKFEARYCENGCVALITGKPTLLVSLEKIVQGGARADLAYLDDALYIIELKGYADKRCDETPAAGEGADRVNKRGDGAESVVTAIIEFVSAKLPQSLEEVRRRLGWITSGVPVYGVLVVPPSWAPALEDAMVKRQKMRIGRPDGVEDVWVTMCGQNVKSRVFRFR